jgi:hypothetical protein
MAAASHDFAGAEPLRAPPIRPAHDCYAANELEQTAARGYS